MPAKYLNLVKMEIQLLTAKATKHSMKFLNHKGKVPGIYLELTALGVW